MTRTSSVSHTRLSYDDSKSEPSDTKRCPKCRRTLLLSAFATRPTGGQGVIGTCKQCMHERYMSGSFRCSMCHETKPGLAFFEGRKGTAVMQPCKQCRTKSKQAATRAKRVRQGRAPYHLLSNIDETARTAACRECGPTHIYATGSNQGRGWRCGLRSDQLSDEWYDNRTDVVDKHASNSWHRVRSVRGNEMRGTCTLCGDVPVRWNQSTEHFTCASPTRKRRHADTERRRRRLAIYGLTEQDYDRMNTEQGGVCAICGGTKSRGDSDGSLVVDHNHKTGRVRSLLCGLCNAGLGFMREDPSILAKADQYLRMHAEAPPR